MTISQLPATGSRPAPGSQAAAASARLAAARQDYEKDAKSTSVADLVGTTPCCKMARDKLQSDLAALKLAQQAVDQCPQSSSTGGYGEF